MKIKSFQCPKSIRNYEKKILGTSDSWSPSRLSHRPSEPAYHIVDCQISKVSHCMGKLGFRWEFYTFKSDSCWFNLKNCSLHIIVHSYSKPESQYKRNSDLLWQTNISQITNIQFFWLKSVPNDFFLVLTKTIITVITL